MGAIIDISSNNTINDWNEVFNAGVTDTIIRLSLGYGDEDAQANSFATGAAAAGIAVSYTHLAYPDKDQGKPEQDAKKEANYFTSLFQAGLMPAPKWLAVDLEVKSDGSYTDLDKADFLTWVQTFLSEVYAATNIQCMIYSGQPYLDGHLPSDHNLGTIPLWISNYNNVTTPPLPIGWDKYFLWQFTNVGQLNGITGFVDISIQNITLTNLDKEKSS